jgi:protein TonB
MVQTEKRHNAPDMRSNPRMNAQERTFWIGLACAALLHAVLIFGIARSSPRQMGEHDGDPEALSVDIVDAASLSGTAAPVPEQSAPAAPAQQSAAAPAEQARTPWVLDTEAMALFPPSGTKDATAKNPSQPQQQARAPLQLNPPDMPVFGAGGGAAVGRPQNITRSGENDEFGRGVVRALRRTMPSPSPIVGRVTIRLFLSESGNLVESVLVRSSGNPHLDQSVLFAAKQSSFPIPPAGSTTSDRTFLVTYIYREAARGN